MLFEFCSVRRGHVRMNYMILYELYCESPSHWQFNFGGTVSSSKALVFPPSLTHLDLTVGALKGDPWHKRRTQCSSREIAQDVEVVAQDIRRLRQSFPGSKLSTWAQLEVAGEALVSSAVSVSDFCVACDCPRHLIEPLKWSVHDHCHCQISLLLENLDRFRRLADITVSPKNFDLRCSNPFESDVVISISFILQSSYWTAETCGTCGSDGSDSSRLPLVWDPSQGAPKSASKCVSAAYGAYGASPSHAFSFASQRRCVSLYNIYICSMAQYRRLQGVPLESVPLITPSQEEISWSVNQVWSQYGAHFQRQTWGKNPDGSWWLLGKLWVSKNFLVLGHLERSLASQKWSRPLAVANHQLHV